MERLTALELETILNTCETPPKHSEFANLVAPPIPSEEEGRPAGKSNPFFTGWKGFFRGVPLLQSVLDTDTFEVEDKTPVFVGQWVFLAKHPGNGVYVNLPSLSGGEYARGQSFDIGTEYLVGSASVEDTERLIEAGYKKVMELAKEAGIAK